ncbi:DNA-3-methyladenine glycosylase 2 family protein [Nocardioides sp. YIM 152588]|uniref:DNA-3-methyladenine glycosylase family protein n=1 Tax=Nocardioides sp. YIM 152588 TaxID=3158259 RepID=UPI0032E3789A
MAAPLRRTWRPGRPVPVAALVGQHRRGGGDPTHRVVDGRQWRVSRTPEGPAATVVAPQAGGADGAVEAAAWGPGAEWALEQLPDLLGEADDWAGFEPRHPVLAEVRRRHPHLRMGRTGLLLESLVPSIIEQKVTGQEAFGGFRSLVRRYGEAAPGPAADLGLRVQPDAATLAGIPSWVWLELHIDPARSRALVEVARRGDAWQRVAARPLAEVDRALRSIPGVGVWTSAEVRLMALGDADAVSFGDFHIAKDVGWALTGAPFDDRALAEFLEPWRPHRGRVPFLVAAAGLGAPRRGPRMAPRSHLPSR